MLRLKKHKWLINWIVFGSLILLFIVFAIAFEDKPWIGNILQLIGTVAGIYLTLIIFFRSKEDSDNQFRDHLEHLQSATSKQIEALHLATEKQIEALHKSTLDEILAFEKQTQEIANKLSENSTLLAELLSRELETAINSYNNIIANEQAAYSSIESFTLLRTPEEKEAQLKNQFERISQFKRYQEYLNRKYQQVKQFLSYKIK